MVLNLTGFSHSGDVGWKMVDINSVIYSSPHFFWNESKCQCGIVRRFATGLRLVRQPESVAGYWMPERRS